MEKEAVAALVHPGAEGFKEKVTPKKIDENKLFLMTCACGKQHFRHAGYLHVVIPLIEQGGEKRVVDDPRSVMICVACKRCMMFVNGQTYDVTDRVDLEAWEKTEKEAHRATGPGGDC